MNCPNCGRPLAEGEVCNCVNNEAPYAPPQVDPAPQAAPPAPEQNFYQQPQEQPVYAQPVQDPQFAQQQNYYQPPQQQAPYYGAPVAPMPPVEVPARTDYPEGYKVKKKYVAVILAVVLGPLGLHNFYLGNKSKGLAQLLICLIGSLLAGLGYIVAYIWAIIEAVQLLTEKIDRDADGFKIQTLEEGIVAEKIKAEKALKDAEAVETEE